MGGKASKKAAPMTPNEPPPRQALYETGDEVHEAMKDLEADPASFGSDELEELEAKIERMKEGVRRLKEEKRKEEKKEDGGALAVVADAEAMVKALEPADTSGGYKGVQYNKRRISTTNAASASPTWRRSSRAARRSSSAPLQQRRRRRSCTRERTGRRRSRRASLSTPLTKEEAVRLASEEGLTLELADTSGGYKGVYYRSDVKSKPYEAQIKQGGKMKSLGTFATAEEAALVYARADRQRKLAAGKPPDPEELKAEALRRANAEGLTLESAETTGGYKGVQYRNDLKSKPYQAQISQGGKMKSLGTFATAEEAALAFARADREKKLAAGKPPDPEELKAEALRQANAEGLTLERADTSGGYKGVYYHSSLISKPYQAQISQGGRKLKNLGSFAIAEEAALAFARADREKKLAAGKPLQPPDPEALKAEAVRLASVEGLTLEPAETAGGYKGVQYRNDLKSKPYEARIWQGGKQKSLGNFATAEEAALAFARARAQRIKDVVAAAGPADAPATAEDPNVCPICQEPPDDVGWSCERCKCAQCSSCHEEFKARCAEERRPVFCPHCKLGHQPAAQYDDALWLLGDEAEDARAAQRRQRREAQEREIEEHNRADDDANLGAYLSSGPDARAARALARTASLEL